MHDDRRLTQAWAVAAATGPRSIAKYPMNAVFTALTTMLPCALPIAALELALVIGPARGQSIVSFDTFLSGLWQDAAAQGITRATFDPAFAGMTPDPRVLGAMQRAPEYGKPFGAYVESIVSPSRIGA